MIRKHGVYGIGVMILVAMLSIVALMSCDKDNGSNNNEQPQPPIGDLEIADEFDFNNFQSSNFRFSVSSLDDTPLAGLKIQVAANSFQHADLDLLFSSATDDQGNLVTSINLPGYLDRVFVRTSLLGSVNETALALSGQEISHQFGGVQPALRRNPDSGRGLPQRDLEHFQDPINTGANMSIILTQIQGVDIVAGAELGCYTPGNILAGAEDLDGEAPWGLAAWGDDQTTDDIDGFNSGEPLRFVYWDPDYQAELPAQINVVEGGQAVYLTNGFLVITLTVEPVEGFRYLGSWDENGVGNYFLETRAEITTALQSRLSGLLPEGAPLTSFYPLMISPEDRIEISRETEVFVSLLHENSPDLNAVGFYSHPVGAQPDLENLTIIFPNASFAQSGGGMMAGDRVSLGLIPANSVIGFFMVQDGFKGQYIDQEQPIYYTQSILNMEANPFKNHTSVFLDQGTGQVIIGFEGQPRNAGTDDDFNDVVIAVSLDNPDALNTFNFYLVPENIQFSDQDNDLVPDNIDDAPADANRAFRSSFPSQRGEMYLAFEDDWNVIGDYDFNDLVLGGHFDCYTNGAGQVRAIEATFKVKAAGSLKRNGFGFQLQVPPDALGTVTGLQHTTGSISLNANNTEAGQEFPVIIVFDDVRGVLPNAGDANLINTEPEGPKLTHNPLVITIPITGNITMSALGAPPFDPFIYVDQQRGREVHAAHCHPTTLANRSLFGQGDDRSNIEQGWYYKTARNLPWALVLPGNWKHPLEGTAINQAYPGFGAWAEGTVDQGTGWYLPIAGNYVPEQTWNQ